LLVDIEETVIQYFIIKREALLHILTCKRSIAFNLLIDEAHRFSQDYMCLPFILYLLSIIFLYLLFVVGYMRYSLQLICQLRFLSLGFEHVRSL